MHTENANMMTYFDLREVLVVSHSWVMIWYDYTIYLNIDSLYVSGWARSPSSW